MLLKRRTSLLLVYVPFLAVRSSKMPFGCTLAILDLPDGPVGVDLASYVVWIRFRLMCRYLAYRPLEIARIYRLMDLVAHWPLAVALFICFWYRLLSSGLSGYIQHFQSGIFWSWQLEVGAQLAERECFRSARFLDVRGSQQLLIPPHLRERDEMLPRSILCGSVWNVFFREGLKVMKSGVGSVESRMVIGIFFGDFTFLPAVHVRDLPDFCLLLCVIAANGLPVFSRLVGCLASVSVAFVLLGLTHWIT